ncbi:MAG: DNA polymerase III [Candidatus Ryanbacteria bacterium RIFCSPHIGHO2_02_FULL_48_12]|uniref:DNA polymerase III n=1 Tax=Candidatus Ryanbacteria bacterium RIFCSPHIGHO2_01_FULL_48_27 TaxID=1802115 RepID=A0A1G2G776_9BACT|nr:MAG: DNA polymerase III [Candidatus Ryanbacteria bacterium RIFCSPHIGHO2_01_FULL_48_27]OGZ49828.1 MAG: DNA polymerase III [Candidatus Ryanbacteria bacterium RIFCSPHIGHO2_02_FULL_48_12]
MVASNKEIADLLFETGALLEMEGVAFKPRAFERAALAVESSDKDIASVYREHGIDGLLEIPSVGKGIAEHIKDIITKGDFAEHKRLKKKIPVRVSELLQIEGVGPKMIKTLWDKLRVKNLKDLETAVRVGKIRTLPHFGQKSQDKIQKGITFLKKSGGRKSLGEAWHDAEVLKRMIASFPGIEHVVLAGSLRRRKETIGDIDMIAVAQDPAHAMGQFARLPMVAHIYAQGPAKTLVRLKNGMDADLRVVPEESFGAALNYFTGSKEHNIALREIAIKKNLKLNEYGLYKGVKRITGRTEEELYKALGLDYIEPEMREMTGEIEAARQHKLPKLINYGDLRGDLQTQTDWTDGEDSIEAMALAAEEAGLEYIAITDHTQSLAMTGGSDEKKLLRQIAEIDRIQKKLQATGHRIVLLKGAEVNILKDGSLDIDDPTLMQLDIVGAAVHSNFNLSEIDQTKRVIRAMENPHVDILFHPTGRIINKREPIELGMDAIIKTAKRTGTILEIDAHPERLDLKDAYIRACVQAGVKMSIDSDAHAANQFSVLEFGVATARRGWATKKDIINAWPLKKLRTFLKK